MNKYHYKKPVVKKPKKVAVKKNKK